jgi:phosphatidylinositol dimannoside acyltransferase
MYFLLKFLQVILRNIPRKAGYFIFESLFTAALLFPSKRKRTLKKNLSNVLGHDAPASLLREVYRCYARYYFDLYQDNEKIFPSVVITPEFQHAYDVSKDLLNRYNGLIILSLHICNWDFGGSYLSYMYPQKGNVVVEKLSPPVYKWFTETRQKWGMKVITSSDMKSMMNALKNKEVLVLAADRDLEKAGYRMEFFGKKAYIPSGPAKLALTYGVPIMLGGMTRDKDNPLKFVPFFYPEALNLERAERTEENTVKLTRSIVKLMERSISSSPEQWCMLQQVWVDEQYSIINEL